MKRYVRCLLPAMLLLPVSSMSEDVSTNSGKNCTFGGSPALGMVVHMDPATGRPTSLPTPEQSRAMAALLGAQGNRSTVGLVEERGPTGGVKVNLRNRFRSPVVAVRGKDGAVTYDHLNCTPAKAFEKAGGNS